MIISDYYSTAIIEQGRIAIEDGDIITFYPPEWVTDIIMAEPANDALTAPMFDDFEIDVTVKSFNKSGEDYPAKMIVHCDGAINVDESFHLEVGLGVVYALKYHLDGGIQLPLLEVQS